MLAQKQKTKIKTRNPPKADEEEKKNNIELWRLDLFSVIIAAFILAWRCCCCGCYLAAVVTNGFMFGICSYYDFELLNVQLAS